MSLRANSPRSEPFEFVACHNGVRMRAVVHDGRRTKVRPVDARDVAWRDAHAEQLLRCGTERRNLWRRARCGGSFKRPGDRPLMVVAGQPFAVIGTWHGALVVVGRESPFVALASEDDLGPRDEYFAGHRDRQCSAAPGAAS